MGQGTQKGHVKLIGELVVLALFTLFIAYAAFNMYYILLFHNGMLLVELIILFH